MEKKSQKLRFPDPKMGIMWPVVEEETGVEYCLWVKVSRLLPFLLPLPPLGAAPR